MIRNSSLLDQAIQIREKEETEVTSMTVCDGQITETIYTKAEKEEARSEQAEYHRLGSADLSFHLLQVSQRHPGVQTSQNLRFPNKDRVHSY